MLDRAVQHLEISQDRQTSMIGKHLRRKELHRREVSVDVGMSLPESLDGRIDNGLGIGSLRSALSISGYEERKAHMVC